MNCRFSDLFLGCDLLSMGVENAYFWGNMNICNLQAEFVIKEKYFDYFWVKYMCQGKFQSFMINS